MKIITQAKIFVVGDDLSIAAKEKLAYLVVMMAGSGLKYANEEKGYVVQTNCHALCINRGI
jgi:hypothetical protein